MNLYVIQVKTGKEDTYIKLWESKKGHLPLKIIWLRKELMIRKNGHTHKGYKSVFPGYLFLEAEKIDPDTFQMRLSSPFPRKRQKRYMSWLNMAG